MAFENFGLLIDLAKAWGHLVFGKGPPPVTCHRCRREFPDSGGVTGQLASKDGIESQIYCDNCYAPYVSYIDSRNRNKRGKKPDGDDEPKSVEEVLNERDAKDPVATAKDIQACFLDRRSSSLAIVSAKKKVVDDEEEKRRAEELSLHEKMARSMSLASSSTGGSSSRSHTTVVEEESRPAMAPFLNIGESIASPVTNVATLIATQSPLSPPSALSPAATSDTTPTELNPNPLSPALEKTLQLPAPSRPTRSPSPSLSIPRNILHRRSSSSCSKPSSLSRSDSGSGTTTTTPGRSSASYIGATVLKAGLMAMQITGRPPRSDPIAASNPESTESDDGRHQNGNQ